MEHGEGHADDAVMLARLTEICDGLAWDRPADEDGLFDLTREGAASPEVGRLAEAFGLMLVRLEAREIRTNALVEELERRNAGLEETSGRLTEALAAERNARRIVGSCEAMRAVTRQALAIAARPISTLILGATGTGKEVVARTIHYSSARRAAPFVAINCSAIPETLFESEMFGIEKGVATGVGARRGLMELASGGTLFLDEIADLSPASQAKLLRALEEKEVMRVGGSRPIPVDVGVIAAANADMDEAVAAGRFRSDLYYRIAVTEIRLPPLNERGDDILLLARHLLERHARAMARPGLALSPAACACLMAYGWPGNVRELNNEMERAAALGLHDVIGPEDLSPRLLEALARQGFTPAAGPAAGSAAPPAPGAILPESVVTLEEGERFLVRRAMDACAGNRSRAAAMLGITREGLRKKLLRLDPDAAREDGR